MTEFSVEAFAKVNLFLEVLDQRMDGYHNVLLVNQTVDLADRLTFRVVGGLPDRLEIEGPAALDLEERPGGNTVAAALRLVRMRFPDIPGFQIRLEKHIPMGAGLGGGSADAGAVIRTLSEHFSLNWDKDEMLRLAVEVGSDVPFSTIGGTALVRGKGEQVEPLPFPFDGVSYVILSPDVEVNTGWAYRTLGRIRQRPRHSAAQMAEALRTGDLDGFINSIWNSFQGVVFPERPELADLVIALERAGCVTAWMTGSGSNLIGICLDRETAERAVADVEWPCPASVRMPASN